METTRKSLANCNFKEFAQQSNKIRKAVSEYLTETEILELRNRLPEIPEKATDTEKEEIFRKQGLKNFSDMLDTALETNIDATMRMIGLLFFTEDEEEINALEPADVIECVASKRVINFFISLKKLGIFATANS